MKCWTSTPGAQLAPQLAANAGGIQSAFVNPNTTTTTTLVTTSTEVPETTSPAGTRPGTTSPNSRATNTAAGPMAAETVSGNSDDGASTGAIVGAVIGALAVIAIILGVLYFRSRNRSTVKNESGLGSSAVNQKLDVTSTETDEVFKVSDGAIRLESVQRGNPMYRKSVADQGTTAEVSRTESYSETLVE